MMTRRPILLSALVLATAPFAACNSFTGADELVVFGESGSGASNGGTGASSSVGAGGPGGNSTSNTGMPQPPPMVEAQGVSISEIAIYQGVKRSLMKDGAKASSSTPVVAGRDALVRVFFATDGGYDGSPVTANLIIGEGSNPITVTKTLGGVSSDSKLDSTINFDVPGDAIASGAGYRVELQQPSEVSPGGNAAANYPATGFEPLNAQSNGNSLKVKLVPIKYAADGSNRLPDTSPAQLQRYKDEFFAIYPVKSFDLTVRAAVTWNYGVYANGAGWGELLDSIANLRQQDGTPADVYYMGIFEPASSEQNYCGGGCVAGLGMLGGPGDSYSHAAIGLGYTGVGSTETAVHEIGHNHGRNHAPCGGASGVDGAYPYSNAKIGVWGYDLVNKTLFSPNNTSDMMGYCWPIWVSDYTFNALFKRIQTVNNADIYYPPESLDLTYERARVDGEGNITWLDPVDMHLPPMADATPITFNAPEGDEAGVAQYYPYDHLPGGVLVWPQAKPSVTKIQIQLAGKLLQLSR